MSEEAGAANGVEPCQASAGMAAAAAVRMRAGEASARAALAASVAAADHTSIAAALAGLVGADPDFADGFIEVVARVALAGAQQLQPVLLMPAAAALAAA